MGRRAGLSIEAVITAAAQLADAQGLEAVTLAAVADRLGVRSPSLYAHVDGLPGLRRALALMATKAMASALAHARRGRHGALALRAVAHAYRGFAQAHPGWYAAAQQAIPASQDTELYRALTEVVVPLVETLGEMGVPSGEVIHQTRAVRSALHGFVSLERSRGFGLPTDFDDSFDRMVELLVRGVGQREAGTR